MSWNNLVTQIRMNMKQIFLGLFFWKGAVRSFFCQTQLYIFLPWLYDSVWHHHFDYIIFHIYIYIYMYWLGSYVFWLGDLNTWLVGWLVSHIFMFTPIWWKWSHFDLRIFFKWVGWNRPEHQLDIETKPPVFLFSQMFWCLDVPGS